MNQASTVIHNECALICEHLQHRDQQQEIFNLLNMQSSISRLTRRSSRGVSCCNVSAANLAKRSDAQFSTCCFSIAGNSKLCRECLPGSCLDVWCLAGAACAGLPIRVVGSGLSPNGMAFSSEGMLSTALLDNIIAVDTAKQQVTVQAGARVDQVHGPCL